MSLGDLTDNTSYTPAISPPIVPKEPVQAFPHQYALRLKDGSYFRNSGYPWTMDVQFASLWTDKETAEAIVVAWNKESKDKHKDSAIIGGRAMKDNVHVVDVSKSLRLSVIQIGGCNYYTGGDWAGSVDRALAFRVKADAEAIIQKNNMGGWAGLLEIPLDRANFI